MVSHDVLRLTLDTDVPEGCVIIREHVPVSNLFTCLWFNEVDRFTSRDQISFSTVRDKIASRTNWTINMFLDCERRNFVVQVKHSCSTQLLLLSVWNRTPRGRRIPDDIRIFMVYLYLVYMGKQLSFCDYLQIEIMISGWMVF